MKKSMHSEIEMVKAVSELENGSSGEAVARKYSVTRATLYRWRARYSGAESGQKNRIRELEEENRKLKQMYAELALENKMLRDMHEDRI